MITMLLKLLSEAGDEAVLSGSAARPYYGPVFDRLLKARILVEQAPLEDWDLCNGCECGLLARPVRPFGDRFRADCPLDASRDVVLERDDLRVFEIGVAVLMGEIAIAAGFNQPPVEIIKGLWCLGDTRSGRGIYYGLNLASLDRGSLIAIVRQSKKTGRATIITQNASPAAKQWLQEAGIDHAKADDVVKPAENRPGFVFDHHALDAATGDPELIVQIKAAQIEWQGRSATFSHQIFPVFQRLLEKVGSRDAIASGPYLEDTTGREAKDLIRELRDQMKTAGFSDAESKILIKTARNRGYFLGVDAESISVIG